MKKFSKILAMVMVALMMMSVVAFADAAIEKPTVEEEVVTVQLTGLTAGEEATILVVNNSVTDLAKLQSGDIVYIDQLTVEADNTVTFTLDASKAVADEVTGEKIVDIYCGYTNMDVVAGPLKCEDLLINPVDTPDVVYGDLNGDGKATAADASLVLQYAATLITFTDAQRVAADVSGDGKQTAVDASYILQKAATLIDKFPVENAQ